MYWPPLLDIDNGAHLKICCIWRTAKRIIGGWVSVYSGLTGSNLMAWLSFSFFTDSLTLTDVHTLWIRRTLLTGGGTLSWNLIFTLYPHTGIPMDQGSRMKRKGKLRAVMGHADWRVHQALGLSFFKDCRKQSILWVSAGFSAHTDLQAKDQPWQIFRKCSNHDLEDRILCPFFLRLISLSIMHLRGLHCPTILLFATQKNIFVNGSIISAVSLLVHRKFPFWTGAHSFCCTIVHFMACHSKKKSFLVLSVLLLL